MGAIRALITAVVVAGAVFVPTLGSDPAPEDVTTEVLSTQAVSTEAADTPAATEPDPAVEPGLSDDPATDAEPALSDLELLVYQRTIELGRASPGVTVSVTVSHAGEVVSVAGTVPFDPASTAKLYWLAAAVDGAGVDAVTPFAEAIFASSDNQAASQVIDLVGIDAINDFTAAAGMGDTYLSLWIDGGIRRAGVEAAEREFRNTSTTADAVAFLDRLADHELLDLADSAQVMAWMTFAPDRSNDPDEWGAILTERLPPDVAALTMHKAGWLPPGCCVALDSSLSAVGLVPLPDGSRFAIAVATVDGDDFEGQASWISQLTAEIYDLLATPPT